MNKYKRTGPHKFPQQLKLLATGVFCILLIIGVNKPWFERIGKYWTDFLEQQATSDVEVRKAKRYGNAYILSKNIADRLEKQGKKENAVVLMPPASYFTAHKLNYPVPEPAVFYYYTGLKTVRPDTRDSTVFNWVVLVKNGKLTMGEITTNQQRATILGQLKKYKITL